MAPTFTWDGLKVPAGDPTLITDQTFYPSIVEYATTTFGMKVKITNNEGQTLYFRISINSEGSTPARYTVTQQDLGGVANGSTTEFSYSGLSVTQANAPVAGDIPSGNTLNETVNFRVSAYTDSGYTNLFGYQNFDVPFKWLNESDAGWTVVDTDDFDDGTVQGWSVGGSGSGNVASDYYKSAPYSYKRSVQGNQGQTLTADSYKNFTIGSVSRAYVILYTRRDRSETSVVYQGHRILIAGEIKYVFTFDEDIWVKVVVPLPLNATTELRIRFIHNYTASSPWAYSWMDNVKVIQA